MIERCLIHNIEMEYDMHSGFHLCLHCEQEIARERRVNATRTTMPQRISDEDLEWMIKDNLYRDIDKMALDLRDDRAALTIAIEALEKIADGEQDCGGIEEGQCEHQRARTALDRIKQIGGKS